MKIAILSDFHLGYERFREDAYRQAEAALNKAAEMSDVIVIPGDIFDNRTPKPDVLAEAINIFRNLSKRKWNAEVIDFVGEGQCYTSIPIIAIPGTHERRAQDATDPVDILGMTGLVVDVSNATATISKGQEKVAVVGIGGIADERFKEVVTQINPKPVEGMFSVFMFHESVYEMLPFNESFIRQDELPKGFDLYVCGHIHNKLDSEVHGKKLLIPGSTVLTQLKPGEQERKGFYIYDTISGKYSYEYIESRRFVILKVDVKESGIGTLESEIEKAIGDANDMPIIRVVVDSKQGKAANMDMDLNALPKRYQSRAILEVSKSGISDETVKDANAKFSATLFENTSVKDYGQGVLAEKFKANDVSFGKISPMELFDMLSSEGTKDKVVAKTLEELVD